MTALRSCRCPTCRLRGTALEALRLGCKHKRVAHLAFPIAFTHRYSARRGPSSRLCSSTSARPCTAAPWRSSCRVVVISVLLLRYGGCISFRVACRQCEVDKQRITRPKKPPWEVKSRGVNDTGMGPVRWRVSICLPSASLSGLSSPCPIMPVLTCVGTCLHRIRQQSSLPCSAACPAPRLNATPHHAFITPDPCLFRTLSQAVASKATQAHRHRHPGITHQNGCSTAR
jgi:hypothetical protein